MNDIRYLLSIKELLEASAKEKLLEVAYTKLDRERLRKVQGISQVRKRAESIGAGILLQLGLQDYKLSTELEKTAKTENTESGTLEPTAQNDSVRQFTVYQALARLKTPIETEYTYHENGKPYFKNIPIYFNLSHSEEYVFGVFSEQEVGADIQYHKPGDKERIVRRFFTEMEQKAWDECPASEKEKLFYQLWTHKEAYGKLTGEGIAVATGVNVLTDLSETDSDSAQADTLGICWEEYDLLDDYHITVCKRAGEKE